MHHEDHAVDKHDLWIGGQPVSTPDYDEVRLPFDQSVVAHVAHAQPEHVDHAVHAAIPAAEQMANLTNASRSDLLSRIAELVRADEDMLARLIATESGKPIVEAQREAQRSVETLLAAAHAARELKGEVVPMDFTESGKNRLAMTMREPLGVIGAITPFNFPLNLALHKIAPALGAGNSVVHKPAERTPLSALRLAQLIGEAGAPPGAYNVVTGNGPELAGAMLRNPHLAMITFTGSRAVGEQLRAQAGLKRVTLELGNNAAVIVDADANLAEAAEKCAAGGFAHSGQVCISVQRVLVQDSVCDYFASALAGEAAKLRSGHPLEHETEISSLIDANAAARVQRWIDEALDGGAKLLYGGSRRGSRLEPTVIIDPPASAKISQEEVFGPVIAIYRFHDLDEAIALANSTPYGLQAGVFTQNIGRAFKTARKLHFGGVMINDTPNYRADHMPYGGMKESGLGREGPRYAMEEMTELKLVCWPAE